MFTVSCGAHFGRFETAEEAVKDAAGLVYIRDQADTVKTLEAGISVIKVYGFTQVHIEVEG